MKKLLTISLLLLLASTISYSQSWQAKTVSAPSDIWLGPISIVNENICWASWSTGYVSSTECKNGVIITTDGGETWSGGEIPKIESGIILSIEAIDANTAYIAVENFAGTGVEGLYKTTDGGITWQKDTTIYGSSPSGPGYIHFFDSSNGVVVGEKNTGAGFEIFTTTNGGTDWKEVPQSNIPPINPGEVTQQTPLGEYRDCIWLTTFPPKGKGPRIFKTTDKGYHWSVIAPSGLTDQDLISLAFQDEKNGLMVEFTLNKGKILKTTDGGETWKLLANPRDVTPNFIAYVPGTTSSYVVANDANFAGGPGGSAYTLDEGNTWNLIDNQNHAVPSFYSASVGWSSSFASNTIYKFSGSLTAVSDGSKNEQINSYSLSQNYPNPFNPSTAISYQLSAFSQVTLKVYNVLGREVATLVNELKHAGKYEVEFNAAALPSGVYFYKIKAGNFTDVKKMLLLK